MENPSPSPTETAVDPDRPIEGWWLKIFCAFGWHRRFVHPHNIVVEGDNTFAYARCCGCADVDLI